MMCARYAHIGCSDNGAARRFERSMSFNQPRHWVKGKALVRVLSSFRKMNARGVHLSKSINQSSHHEFNFSVTTFVPENITGRGGGDVAGWKGESCAAGGWPADGVCRNIQLSAGRRLTYASRPSTWQWTWHPFVSNEPRHRRAHRCGSS